MSGVDAAGLAGRLRRAVRSGPRSSRCPPTGPGLGLADGYAVQRVLRAGAGPLVGWKLGVTSRAKQAQVGIDTPVYGFLAAADALAAGRPLDASALIQPRAAR